MWKWTSMILEERAENADWTVLIQLRKLQKKTITFETFCELAERVEVFPVDLWHESLTNKSSFRENNGSFYYGKCRLELTFERYLPLHDFSEMACCITKQELFDIVSEIDKATPREKALILTTIFIYERLRRRKPGTVEYHVTSPLVYPYKIDSSMTKAKWSQLVSCIKRFKDSSDIAFPAFVEEEKTMKEKWENSAKECVQEFAKHYPNIDSLLDIHPYYLYCELVHGYQVNKKIESLQDESLVEAKRLAALREFFYTIAAQHGSSAGGPWCGNSSTEPKALGDIATQLLMSRLPYNGDKQ